MEPIKPHERKMQPLPLPSRMVQLKWMQASIFVYDLNPEAGGDPMIFLHGLGDEADTWRHVTPHLGNRRLVLMDLPGFGRSDKPENAEYHVGFFTGCTLEVMDELRIDKAIFVGHSLGAQIAQWIALTHPDRVSRLCLLGGGLLSPERALSDRIVIALLATPGVGEWIYNGLRKDPKAAYDSLRAYYHNLDALPEQDRAFLLKRVQQRVWSDGQRDAFLKTLRCLSRWLPKRQEGLLRKLNGIRCPCVVACGAEDAVFPAETALTMSKMMPTASYSELPNCGHNAHQEDPAAVARMLLSFVCKAGKGHSL